MATKVTMINTQMIARMYAMYAHPSSTASKLILTPDILRYFSIQLKE